MLEVASIFASYLAFALLHAAAADHVPWLAGLRTYAVAPLLMRIAAAVAFVLSAALWPRGDGWMTSLLASSMALLGSASVVIVFAPVAPRLVWSVAALAPAMIATFALGESLVH
jgi:hypothetical protein